jgi:predicted NBD/HSP70 family sugar kinase
MTQKVLVVDVGGTHLKILASGQQTPRKIASGPKMTARLMCKWVRKAASDWHYDVAAIGYPGPVVHGRPVHEPYNLGKGWVGFDYVIGFGCPVRVINDAAMQAVGSYKGGRMLFLGLGTGLGSAMIVDGIVEPMELAHLPYKDGKTYEDYLGLRGLQRMGKKKWCRYVKRIVEELQTALDADYVVLGGGNVKKIKTLPPRTRLGANGNAFIGGYRLWSKEYRQGSTRISSE